MGPMLYKELLAVRPQLISVLLLGVVLFVGELLSSDSLQGLAAMLTGGIEGLLLLIGGLAFALGHGQIGPEIAHGHVELLDGLPVTRTTVYLTKVIAGVTTVALLVAVTALGQIALTQLTWGRSELETLGTVFGALGAGLFAFYGTGLALSWLGGFGWAVVGVGITVVSTVAELFEAVRPLSLFHGYGAVRFEANVPMIVLWPVVFWAVYGLTCIGLSGLLFVGRSDRLIDTSSGLANGLKAILITMVAGVLLMLASSTVARLGARGTDPSDVPEQVEAGTYRVLVPGAAATAARPLLAQIPEIDAAVRGRLGVKEPLHLDVELGGGGRFHAGQYTGGKIRMTLNDEAADVFAHELTHAYADALSRRRLRHHHDAMRFFNEGLAMWIAERTVSSTIETDAHRAWAGALYLLNHHPIDLLMTDRARSARYDPFEPYPLGLAFVEAVVDTHGEPTLPCLLRAAAELPNQRLAGVAVWSRLGETCRVDLARVDERYESRLAKYAARWPPPPTSLIAQPVLHDDDELYLVLPAVPADEGPTAQRRCRFRSRIGAGPADIEQSEVDPAANRCPVTAVISATDTVSFQVGVELPTGWTVFSRWVEHPVPSSDVRR